MERIRHTQKLGDRLGAPNTCEVSFVSLFEGWVDDIERFHRSLSSHLTDHDWELVVVDNPVDDEGSHHVAALDRVVHIPLHDQLGWAAGRNLGLRLATGRIVIVVDTSVELESDVVEPVTRHLADPGVGLVGKWGVVSDHGFHFEESLGPDVAGVEAYFMAMRRADLPRTGLFHPKFKWYRNADIDFSFRVRDAGLRTIVDPSLPLVRHEHRLWESTPETERDEASRRNFFRFRQHWGDREDLLIGTSD